MVTLGGSGLNSVFMTSATDGWAVGLGGAIYHYTGGGWSVYTTTGSTLNSIFMLSANEGWAVGNGGTIFHYSAGQWAGPVSPGTTSEDLRSVFMLSPTEGWAVGLLAQSYITRAAPGPLSLPTILARTRT